MWYVGWALDGVAAYARYMPHDLDPIAVRQCSVGGVDAPLECEYGLLCPVPITVRNR